MDHLPLLFADICRAVTCARGIVIGEGVLEVPSPWSPALAHYGAVLDARETAVEGLKQMAWKVLLAAEPDLPKRQTDTDLLWQSGIPLDQPRPLPETWEDW